MTDQKIRFNGGRKLVLHSLIQECEPVEFWSATAVRPNTSWRYTDENGHEHRWKQNDDETWRVTKSTTRTEHVPCDGSCGDPGCDGWDTTVYECAKCGQRLEPDWSPDNGMKSIPGPMSITAVVQGPEEDLPGFNTRASFVITEGGKKTMHGTAQVVDMKGSEGQHAEARVDLTPVEAHRG